MYTLQKQSDYLNHIIMQATENWRQEGLGTYSSPNWKCVSETMVGYRVGQGFHLRLFQKQYRGGLLVAVHLFLLSYLLERGYSSYEYLVLVQKTLIRHND